MAAAAVIAPAFQWPTPTDIDRRLLGGAAAFGPGWRLSGLRPGPALTAVALSMSGTLIFVAFMPLGRWLARWAGARRRAARLRRLAGGASGRGSGNG